MTAAPVLGPVGSYVKHHFRHFNAAALVDAAEGYRAYLAEGGKMMVTLAGAMSTAELGLSFAEMIRHPAFDPTPLDTYRGQVIEDLRRLADNPSRLAAQEFSIVSLAEIA